MHPTGRSFSPGAPTNRLARPEPDSGGNRPGEARERRRGREAAGTQAPADEQRGGAGFFGEPEASRAETLALPSRREPDDEQTGFAARLQNAFLTRRCQQRLGRDAQDALNGERAVREQAARVALALLRHRGCTCKPEFDAVGASEPGAELDRRPVVVGSAEGDEHGTRGCRVASNEKRHVAWCLLEERRELLVGSPLGQELFLGVDEQPPEVTLFPDSTLFRSPAARSCAP